MPSPALHKFEVDGRCFAMDIHSCFCFECDRISWDVLAYYPEEPINRIYHLLKDRHPREELEEVVGELEWLRVTKAILSPPDDQGFLEEATRTGGLNRLTLNLRGAVGDGSWVGPATRLLFARAEGERDLVLSLLLDAETTVDWKAAAAVLEETTRTAKLSGKQFSLEIETPGTPLPRGAGASHAFWYRIKPTAGTDIAAFMTGVVDLRGTKAKTLLDGLQKQFSPDCIQVVVRPQSEGFHTVVESLHQAGFRDIRIDLPMAWAERPGLDPEKVVEALQANATYYTEQLLQNKLFRAEPFASLFKAIHDGTPQYRTDRSGVEALAADETGNIYPHRSFFGNSDFVIGSLADGNWSEEKRYPFLQSGALQIPACLRCWARGLCGGGRGAIHYARSGDVRTPDETWCNAQRRWIGIAVATFNRISSTGINFAHLDAAMGTEKRSLSLLTAAKALLQGRLGMRPLREDDAPWLVRWQNWNRAAYFTCNESGALLATQYDREMDALHPPAVQQELVLTQRNGTPCGLIKMRPIPDRGLALAWLYVHEPDIYAKAALHHTLRDLLQEITASRQLRHILIPVTADETGLTAALAAVGFVEAGIEREALFRQGAYHDVYIYKYAAAE